MTAKSFFLTSANAASSAAMAWANSLSASSCATTASCFSIWIWANNFFFSSCKVTRLVLVCSKILVSWTISSFSIPTVILAFLTKVWDFISSSLSKARLLASLIESKLACSYANLAWSVDGCI